MEIYRLIGLRSSDFKEHLKSLTTDLKLHLHVSNLQNLVFLRDVVTLNIFMSIVKVSYSAQFQ